MFEAKKQKFELISGTPDRLRAAVDGSVLHLASGRRGTVDEVLCSDENSELETVLVFKTDRTD